MKLPKLKVRHVPGGKYDYWHTADCPYCGKRHEHAARAHDGRLLLKSRYSHCGAGQYELVLDKSDRATVEAAARYGLHE